MFVLLLSVAAVFAQKQPFDVHAMMQISRISEPQISGDGKTVAFTVQTIDLDKNTKPKRIFVFPLTAERPKPLRHKGRTVSARVGCPTPSASYSSRIAAGLRRSGA